MIAFLALNPLNTANAYVFWGNPELKLEIDRKDGDLTGGDVDLLAVRVHRCGGGYDDYFANQTIDPVAGWTTTIEGGNLCSVQVRWDSDAQVWSNAFTLKSTVLIHTVSIGGPVSKASWTPFTVAAGSFSGTNPNVVITIDD